MKLDRNGIIIHFIHEGYIIASLPALMVFGYAPRYPRLST